MTQINDALRHLEKDMAEILEVIQDKKTTEVILNPYKNVDGSYEGHILVKRHGEGLQNLTKIMSDGKSEIVKMSATKAETIMSVLASITGKFIHNKNPYLECQIPKYGHRFTGVIPPASVFPPFVFEDMHRLFIPWMIL